MKFALFDDFASNILRLFTIRNLALLAAAVVLSVISVYSGFDWLWFTGLHGTRIYSLVRPAVSIGMLVPIFGLLLWLCISYLRKSRRQVIVAFALGQAAIIGYFVSTVLKAVTGRLPPPHAFVRGMLDSSYGFQFGWLRGGVFWGWPSSHTMVAFAMACALIALYPKSRAVKAFALIYALYIGIGVSMSIHWFSEFIAGAILGHAIGVVVGKSFRKSV